MTDEEAIQLKQAFVDLQQAFLNLEKEVMQKNRRIRVRIVFNRVKEDAHGKTRRARGQ